MTDTHTDWFSWFAFVAYNQETLYGYGNRGEAVEELVRYLNLDREINVYHAKRMTEDEARELGLEDRSDTFNLDDALAGLDA